MSRPSTGKPELPRVPEEPPVKPYSPPPPEKLTPEKYYKLNEAVLIETGMTGVPHRPAPPPPSYRVQIAVPPGGPPPRPSDDDDGPTFFFGIRKGPGAKVLVGIVALLFFIAAGLAAGLGVSQRDLKQTRTALQDARVSLASTPKPTPPPTPFIPSDVQCPSINGTTHTVATNATAAPDRRRFTLLCGIDFSGEGEATDIGAVKTLNLAACADACAANANCTGAGWGVIPGDAGPAHRCWMKKGLIRGHVAAGGWGFALMMTGRNGTD